MRLAFIVTPEQPVPPKDYGGIECCVDIMIRKLVFQGHTIALYAGPDSTCPATMVYPARRFAMSEEKYLVQKLVQILDDYDNVVDCAAHHLAGQLFPKDKVISLMFGDPYKKYPHDAVKNRVYKSRELAWHYGCGNHSVLTNPVEYDPSSSPLGCGDGGYAFYMGHIAPFKGVHIAAEACMRLGKRLVIAGKIKDQDYFKTFEEDVEHIGSIGQAEKDKWLGGASVFLHPVQCCDCDPLGPKEAMLRGTPVVACPNGGILSSMQAGISGYFANTPEEFANAIIKCESLDRGLIRREMIRIVDLNRNIEILLELCKRVIAGKGW